MRASNEASTSTELTNALFRSRPEAVLDLIAAVKGLHELSPQQLAKLMKDSGHNVVQHVAEDGSLIQVDMEKFARYLPLHLISVIMAWERDGNTFKYLLCGILLLHSMCDLATRVPKIEQILLDDMKVSEQLIDLVFYLLVFLGAYRKENNVVPNDIVLLHSALVACSLKLLTVIVSPQYQEVAQVLNAYYKVDIFIDAAFAAVCTDVNFLQKKLSAEMVDSSANTTPSAEETLNHLCQQCDSSLQFLQSLCQQKLFRECIVKNKELCGNGCVLILVLAVMNLKISPLYSTSLYIASVSRLKTKALSILLYLREAENVSYLDEVASNPGSQNFYEGTSSKNELGEAMEVDLVKEADSWQRAFSKMGMGKLFQPSDEQVFSMLPEDFKTFLTSDLAPQIMAELPKLSPRLTESLEQLMVKLHGWISSSQTAFDSEINTIKTVSSKLEEATRIQNHTIASYEAKLRHLDQEGAQLLEPIKGIVDNFERVQTLCMSLYDSNLKLAEATNRLGKQVELDRQSKDFESDVALFKVLFSNLQDSLDHTGKRLDSVDNRLDDIKKGEEALKLKLVEEVTAQVMKTVQQGIDERIEQRMEALKEPIANAILADMAEQLSEVQKQKATEALKVKLSKGTDRDVNGPDQVG